MNPVIRKLQHGAELSPTDCALLEETMSVAVRVAEHEDLVQEGEPSPEVQVVLEGFACRYKTLPDGGRQIMAWLLPGDFCDLHVSVLGEMDHSVGTLAPSVIGKLPRDGLEAFTDRRPALTRAFWWATLVDAAILREWLVNIGRRPGDARIAHLICETLHRLQAVGLAEDNSFVPPTQIDMADTVGLSAVHVNRIVQQLRRDRLIAWRGRRLRILDLPALQALGGFNPNYLHMSALRRRSAA